MRAVLVKGYDYDFDNNINEAIQKIESKVGERSENLSCRGRVTDIKFTTVESAHYALILWSNKPNQI